MDLDSRIDIVCIRHPNAENSFHIFAGGRQEGGGTSLVFGVLEAGPIRLEIHDLDLGAAFDASQLTEDDRGELEGRITDWNTRDVPQGVRDFCTEVYQELLDEIE